MCSIEFANRPISTSLLVSSIIDDMIIRMNPKQSLVQYIYVRGYAFLAHRGHRTSKSWTVEGPGFDIMTIPTHVESMAMVKEAIALEVLRIGDRFPKTPTSEKFPKKFGMG